MADQRREVVFAAYDGVQLLDVAGPLDVFDTATRVLRSSDPSRIDPLDVPESEGPGPGTGPS